MRNFYSNLLFLILFLGCAIYLNGQINPTNSPYYQDGPYDVVADSVTNLTSPILIYRPDTDSDGPYPLFLFHMGANQPGENYITWHSYDLYMQHLASYGYVVGVLQQVPGPPNGPFFSNALDYFTAGVAGGNNWMSTYVDTTKVGVGGHSFGGVAASQIISDQPERVEAIVYFGSFPFLVPGIGQNVTVFDGNLLSIAGQEDMLSDSIETRNGYNAYTNTSCKSWFYIEGLDHAGFGDYAHPTQMIGSIGRTNATATIRHLLLSFLESKFKNTDLGNEQFFSESNYPNTVSDYDMKLLCAVDFEIKRKGALCANSVYPTNGNEIYIWYDESGNQVAQFVDNPYYSPTAIGSYTVEIIDPDYVDCIQTNSRSITSLNGCCELEE